MIRKPRGDNWPLHRYWLRYIRRAVRQSGYVVEVGSGLGHLGSRIQSVLPYVGIDVAFAALEESHREGRVRLALQASAESLPLRTGCAAMVLALDVVEHLKEPGLFLGEAYRILSTDGQLILTTPNTHSLGVRMKRGKPGMIPAMERDSSHVSLLPAGEWQLLAQEAGFKIVSVGTDTLWDIPYSKTIPLMVQKAILGPMNILGSWMFGFFPWSFGENLVIVAMKGNA